MSKYNPLWNWIKENGTDSFNLTYAEKDKTERIHHDIKRKQKNRYPKLLFRLVYS